MIVVQANEITRSQERSILILIIAMFVSVTPFVKVEDPKARFGTEDRKGRQREEMYWWSDDDDVSSLHGMYQAYISNVG